MSILPAPLQVPAFRAYWVARLAATIAQMAMVIVIGWQVYDIARETMGLKEAALRLGLIGVVQFVPLFALTLVAGWAADRVDRRWIARAAVALELVCAGDACAWCAWADDDQPAGALRRRRACSAWPAPSPGRRSARSPPTSCRATILPQRDRFVVDRLAVGRHRRPGASAAISTPSARPRLMRRARSCSRSRWSACSRSGRSRGPRSAARAARGRRWSRPALRPPQPARARRDQPRPVRGAARRGDGDAAGVRARHAPRRARRARPFARRAGGRRDADRRLVRRSGR